MIICIIYILWCNSCSGAHGARTVMLYIAFYYYLMLQRYVGICNIIALIYPLSLLVAEIS